MMRTALWSGLVLVSLSMAGLAQPSGTPPDRPETSLKELLNRQAGMSEAERRAEEDFLNLDLSPDADVSSIERVASAEQNQPYRTCEKTPEMSANLRSPGKRGNRAYRDIAGYLSVTNVFATKDCTCTGKVVPHEAVAMFEDRLRERLKVEILFPDHTRALYGEYERGKKVVDAMCGDY